MVSNNEVDKGCLTILPWVDTMSIDDAFGHCREETASLHNSGTAITTATSYCSMVG